MTKREAHLEAHRRWAKGDPGRIGACHGVVSLRTKKVEFRCEVGYQEVLDRGAGSGVRFVLMGRGRTWEEAFAAASEAIGAKP